MPIYKWSYDLCLYVEQVVRGFSRYHKYTPGAELREMKPSDALSAAHRSLV
ncbi:MAG: hypothetical protein M3461_10520 [Pseudomonadota bacterium]|nr:hypothetical protein [Pseudomonadota bacterium]